LLLDGRMVLEHDFVSQHLAEYSGGLVDDGGKWDCVDDSPVPVRLCMVERKSKRRQCLAAASRHGKAEKPWRFRGTRAHMIENVAATAVDLGVRLGHGRHVPVEPVYEVGQDRGQFGPGPVDLAAFDLGVKFFRIPEVRVYEAGENHAPEKG